jgi:cyclophilin family peptidyl-prolyl cis-trans isomerase
VDYLDGKHTVFGEVAKGLDIIEKLNEWVCDKEGIPYQDIRLKILFGYLYYISLINRLFLKLIQ